MFSRTYNAMKRDVNVRIKKMIKTPKAMFAAKNMENVPAYSNNARSASRIAARLSRRVPKYVMAEVIATIRSMKMLSTRKLQSKVACQAVVS